MTDINTAEPSDWKRRLVIMAILLFGVSTLFPIVASLLEAERAPIWMGAIDVAFAFVLVAATFAISALAPRTADDQAKRDFFTITYKLAHIPLLLLILFFVAGDRIKWNVLLPGLAWRSWLLLYSLPFLTGLWRSSKRGNP